MKAKLTVVAILALGAIHFAKGDEPKAAVPPVFRLTALTQLPLAFWAGMTAKAAPVPPPRPATRLTQNPSLGPPITRRKFWARSGAIHPNLGSKRKLFCRGPLSK